MKFTQRNVAALTPPTIKTIYWADDLPGFGLNMQPTGHASWIVQQRVGRKTVRNTLGNAQHILPARAYVMARDALQELAGGVDLNAAKRAAKARGTTLRTAISDYMGTRKHKQRTIDQYDKRVFNGTFASWLDLELSTLTPVKIEAMFKLYAARAPGSASRDFRVLRAVMRFAAAKYTDGDGHSLFQDPTQRLTTLRMWPKLEPRTAHLSLDQMRQLVRWATDQGTALAALTLLYCLTGARRKEGSLLTAADWNAKTRTVTFRDTKSGGASLQNSLLPSNLLDNTFQHTSSGAASPPQRLL
jgi:hypothetical protein